jgi:hypothetical protein
VAFTYLHLLGINLLFGISKKEAGASYTKNTTQKVLWFSEKESSQT